ncbi:MAG TPA: ABC transporter permease [Acidimicrobiales bacterium]|nr:ABC transporter permease [Acidimicrobiales bacterium]
MLAVTFADLVFRARQFVLAIAGVGLVLSMALLLTGLASGFRAEVSGTVTGVGATRWVLSGAAQGRITAFAAFPELAALVVQREPGVKDAAPLLVVPFQVAHIGQATTTVNLTGVVMHRLGDPAVVTGHRLQGPDQVVADDRLGVPLGTAVVLGGRTLHVVGTVSGRSLVGGVPMLYLPLASAQAITVGGQPLITAIVTDGVPTRLPAGLVARSPLQVINATVGQLKSAVSSIENTRWLMWMVAAVIVASILYVAALERTRDFAVLKALGSSSRSLFGSLILESVVVTLLAAAIAELLANLLTPLFAQPIDITPDAYLSLPLIAIIVGAVASMAALRRVTASDPAAAFA